jgi:hypothetical protein
MALFGAPTRTLGLLGTSHLVNVVLSTFTSWVASGAATVISGVGAVLAATSAVPLGAGFEEVYDSMRRIGLAVGLLFLAAAVIQAVLRQDLGLLVRTVTVRLPLAILLSSVAIWLVEQALAITDSLSATLLGSATGTTQQFISGLAGLLTGPFASTLGFEGLLLALVAAVVAFILSVELVMRAAAVEVAALFLPLALAGVIWPATAHWIRRLAETIASLVLAKLVIAGVLALAIVSIGSPQGANGLIDGIALLLLATLAPFAVFRLLPFVEAETAAQLEGFAGRAHRALRSDAVGAIADGIVPGGAAGSDLGGARPQVPLFAATVPGPPDEDAIEAELANIGPPTVGSGTGPAAPSDPER